MSQSEEVVGRYISLRNMNVIMAAIALVSCVLLYAASNQVTHAYRSMIAETERYIELQRCAYELQKASDYLSEQVRQFVITGDPVFVDRYFEEVNVTRRREKALEELQKDATEAEALAQLNVSMRESTELMDIEYSAMLLTALAYHLDLSALPESVRDAELLPNYRELPSTEQSVLAKTMVSGMLYSAKKSAISNGMSHCLDELARALELRQELLGQRLQAASIRRSAVAALLVLVILAGILIYSRLVIRPMLRDVNSIQQGHRLPEDGVSELRFLANTYNAVFQANQKHQEELDYQVRHDPLTGVYNRSGFSQLLQETALSVSALLIVDVDKFKIVNDTYGHSVGDRVLIQVAETLRKHFREEDAVCRIGGDEFAVFVWQAGAERKAQIKESVDRVNEELLHPNDGLPAVSISVGCAFGNENPAGTPLEKNADRALYRVKENGRCGCAFYTPETDAEPH